MTGSNRRPQPCQGCALPAELTDRVIWYIYYYIHFLRIVNTFYESFYGIYIFQKISFVCPLFYALSPFFERVQKSIKRTFVRV